MIRSTPFLLPILLCLRTVLALLLLAAPIHAATPFLGPELPISTPTIGRAYADQDQGAIASNGDQALVVWKDARGGIYGARLDADGNVLDPAGFLIDSFATWFPSVAWNGTDYVVVAQEGSTAAWAIRVGTDGLIKGDRQPLGPIYNRTVASNGAEVMVGARHIDSKGIGSGVLLRLTKDATVAGTVPIANTGSDIVPVADGSGWFAFYTTRKCVEQSGFTTCRSVLSLRDLARPDSVELFDGLFETGYVSAASDGNGRFLVTWGLHEDTGAFRSSYIRSFNYAAVDRTGKVLTGPSRIEVSEVIKPGGIIIYDRENSEKPAVAWDGQQFVVAWSWWDGNGESELRVQRFRSDGGFIEQPIRIDRRREERLDPYREAAFATTRSRLLLLSTQNLSAPIDEPRADIVLRAVRSYSELAQPAEPTVVTMGPQPQTGAALTAGDDGFLAAWTEGLVPKVMARVFSYSGGASEVVTLSTGERLASRVAAGFTGGVYLVAWREEEYGRNVVNAFSAPVASRIMLRRFDRSGRPLDAAPFELRREEFVEHESDMPVRTLAITGDGRMFLLAWAGVDDLRTHAVRIGLDGTILDKPLLGISPFTYAKRGSPSAISNGRDFLVTWFEDRVYTQLPFGAPRPKLPHHVRSMRLSPEGNMLDASLLFETEPVFEPLTSGFRAVSNGSEMLLLWNWYDQLARKACTFTRRYNFSGQPLDAPLDSQRCQSSWSLAPTAVWYRGAWRLFESNITGGAFMTTRGEPGSALSIGGDQTLPILETAITTPIGIIAAYRQRNAATGFTPRLFFRRITEEPRSRAVRF